MVRPMNSLPLMVLPMSSAFYAVTVWKDLQQGHVGGVFVRSFLWLCVVFVCLNQSPFLCWHDAKRQNANNGESGERMSPEGCVYWWGPTQLNCDARNGPHANARPFGINIYVFPVFCEWRQAIKIGFHSPVCALYGSPLYRASKGISHSLPQRSVKTAVCTVSHVL